MDITATFPGDSEADKEITEQVHKVWAVRDTLMDEIYRAKLAENLAVPRWFFFIEDEDG